MPSAGLGHLEGKEDGRSYKQTDDKVNSAVLKKMVALSAKSVAFLESVRGIQESIVLTQDQINSFTL